MTVLDDFLEHFPSCTLPEGTVKQMGKEYYLLSPQLQKIVDALPERPEAAGLFLGEEKRGLFIPSANVLALLNDHKDWISLDQKTAWLYVCGRDVFPKSIVDQSPATKNLVVVKNERGEIIGLAKFDKKNNVFKNVMDLGNFLRKEK